MRENEATDFKKHCFSILDEVGEEGLVITKLGRPVAKLIPLRGEPSDLIGVLAGKLTIKDDILSTGA